MTNFEKIKNMSVDEMADKLVITFCCDYHCPIRELCDEDDQSLTPTPSCGSMWRMWLESEVKDEKLKTCGKSLGARYA